MYKMLVGILLTHNTMNIIIPQYTMVYAIYAVLSSKVQTHYVQLKDIMTIVSLHKCITQKQPQQKPGKEKS